MTNQEIKEVVQRIRIPVRECDYEEYLMSGTRLMQYGVDCASELNIRRDGQAGMVANVNADILEPVYGCDIIEVTARIERVGNRSRTVSFEIVKVVERGFDNGDLKNEVLESPVTAVKGTVILVLEKQFMERS